MKYLFCISILISICRRIYTFNNFLKNIQNDELKDLLLHSIYNLLFNSFGKSNILRYSNCLVYNNTQTLLNTLEHS